MSYFEHDSFRKYFKELSLDEIRDYLRGLFSAIQCIHELGIIHRDVKPSNFLYNRNQGRYMLVDFGLAEIEPELEACLGSNAESPSITLGPSKHGKSRLESLHHFSRKPFPAPNSSKKRFNTLGKSVLILDDKRMKMNAPRGGTRGFRAPEVLLRHQYQTSAIDVWSAGVIFLSILSLKYPFFDPPNDMMALYELILLYGTDEFCLVAQACGKELKFGPHLPRCPKYSWSEICHSVASLTSNPSQEVTFPQEAYDLLNECLCVHPKQRITAAAALQHPFLIRK
eukprot:Sdes_comp17334_c0_seq1m6537